MRRGPLSIALHLDRHGSIVSLKVVPHLLAAVAHRSRPNSLLIASRTQLIGVARRRNGAELQTCEVGLLLGLRGGVAAVVEERCIYVCQTRVNNLIRFSDHFDFIK